MDQLLPTPATPGEALLIQQKNMLFQENCVRSQNEQALYAAWKHAIEESSTLNTLLNTLQAQIQELRSEISNLKGENELVRKPEPEPEPIEYHTDEE
jgi:dynactin complex subunit